MGVRHVPALFAIAQPIGKFHTQFFADSQSIQDPITDLCYEPGRRMYDFITPMKDARAMALAAREFSRGLCAGVTGPADVALYPLVDINTAKAVHNIANAFLFTLIHVPSVTVQRCRSQGNDLIYCLPDFEPSLNMLVAGLRNLGDMLDNWLDVASIIVQVITIFFPCTQQKFADPCARTIISPLHRAHTEGFNAASSTRSLLSVLPKSWKKRHLCM
jgi:hypothetical protein